MSIITQKYKNIILESLKTSFLETIAIERVSNYIEFYNSLDDLMLNVIKKTIKTSFEKIDETYKKSLERKSMYYTKGKYPRTLMTLFGEITFEREYYVSKTERCEGFFYVDKQFGLVKRDYYDPMIKAYLIELSGKYSYAQSGEIIGDKIGRRFKNQTDTIFSKISRQTVYNILKKADLDYQNDVHKDPVKTLYIQLDEKWVYTQGNENHMKEVKAAIIYTGIEAVSETRNKLVNRHFLTSDKSANDLRERLLDYIHQTYDVNQLEYIVISGDGAPWIKNATFDFKIHKDLSAFYVLDRFHMHQAINHITKDETEKYFLRYYLKKDMRKDFKSLCDTILSLYPQRNDVITKNTNYLLSNWAAIQNQSHHLFKGCSMEGHISHYLAALFTARPKAHCLSMLSKRLKLREHIVNQIDVKEVYLNNHVNLAPEISLVELNHRYSLDTFDVIGRKVTEKYKYFKSISHSNFI